MRPRPPALVIVIGMALAGPAAGRERTFNDFDDGTAAGFTSRGYALEDAGSYSDLEGLRLEVADGQVVIAGVGSHTVTTRDGKLVGWVGRSLTTDAVEAGGLISVECDAEVSAFESGGGGFQLTLLIEFSPDDRIMFSLVTPSAGRGTQFEIILDEDNALRFTPRELAVPYGQVTHMKLELDTTTSAVRGLVDGQPWQAEVFRGTLGKNPRIGLAATVRSRGDDLLGRFDNLAVAFDRSFRRGDVNGDEATDLSDAIRILNYLFRGETEIDCPSAADADDNGSLQINDAVFLLRALFQSASPIPPPSAGCGFERRYDSLTCKASGACDDWLEAE